MVMREDFGIPLEIGSRFAHGIEQVQALNAGNEADFAIMADPNVFMTAQAETALRYRFLLPCSWQTNHVVRRRKERSYDIPRIWYASGSSGEEQVIMGLDVGPAVSGRECKRLGIEEISQKIDGLEFGEAIIAWEPLITLKGVRERSFEAVETSDYRLSTSLYCHRNLAANAAAPMRNAFQDCLIAAWNFSRIYQREMSLRLILDKTMHADFRRILAVM